MSRIKRLIKTFDKFISVPWRDDAAAAQRVVFCVYHETEERALRTKIDEFELVSRQAGHDWFHHDLTNTFAEWLASQRYAKSYFNKPKLLATIYPKYLEYVALDFERKIVELENAQNSVVAISGVGSLFGLIKVKDGYDGWKFLAVPLTSDKIF